jgi:putative oxidoreductase
MHGWMKYQGGVEGVEGMLTNIGFPMPGLFAVLLIAAEVVGGLLLIVGAFTRWAAFVTGIVALVAFLTVHASRGFFVGDGGYEFIVLILAACVAVLATGAGSYSLDRMMLKI